MGYLNLVTDLVQVKQNIKRYNLELQNGEMTLKTNGVQQWYYIMELDLFGPSRYIGYEDITIHKHKNASNLNGGETTTRLNKWFDLCDDPELFEKLTEKLLGVLSPLDMDIRRNNERQPSFKLNILKENIPKLKQLYISEEVVIDNGKCQTCNKSFWKEPFYAHDNRGPYCSQKCMPDGVLDENGAFDYVNYVEIYRELKETFHQIENVEMRDELKDEISQIFVQMGEFLLKDPESEYEEFIVALLPKFEELYDDTWDYFVDNSHLDIQQAVRIQWHYLVNEGINMEVLTIFATKLEKQLKEVNSYFEILYFRNFIIDHSTTNTIFYESYHATNETDFLLERIYYESILFLSNYDLEQDASDYIDKTLVAVCPKCTLYETLEDFSMNEELNLFCCQSCS